MSPLRRHIFVCFMAKSAFGVFFGPSSIKKGSDPYSAWMKYVVCLSTYIENLGSGGLLPAELRGRVCLFVFFCFFCFFCLSVTLRIYDARHRKPRRYVYALNLGGTGISPPDNSLPGKRPPRTKAPWTKIPQAKSAPGQKTPGEKVPPGKRPPNKNPPARRTPNKRRHILLQP